MRRTVATFPQTFYFVAAIRTHARDGRLMLCTESFDVSGVNPLTRDEAVNRFEATQAAEWSESRWGPMADWVRGLVNVRSVWQSQE